MVLEKLEEPVALQVVQHREERIRPGHAQRLAGLLRSARGSPLGLAEHEVRRRLRPFELRDCGNDVLVAIQDQQEVRLGNLSVGRRLDHGERERRATVLRVALVVEVDVVAMLGDVLEVRVRLRHRAVDGRLVLGIEPVRLREAAVLGDVDAVGHPGDEVVLHRKRAVLARECRRRLPGAGQPHGQTDLLAVVRRDDLAARVQREAAAVVDELVPHPQAALLRLAEVVRVEDARDALLEVDGDQAVVRVAVGLEVRRVDDRQLGLDLLALRGREVELLLHAGDVRVRGFDVEARGRAEGGVVADVAVDLHHLAAGDVLVLLLRPLRGLVGRNRLVLAVRLVRDEVGGLLGPREHLGLDVEIAVPRLAGGHHLRGERLDLLRGGVLH